MHTFELPLVIQTSTESAGLSFARVDARGFHAVESIRWLCAPSSLRALPCAPLSLQVQMLLPFDLRQTDAQEVRRETSVDQLCDRDVPGIWDLMFAIVPPCACGCVALCSVVPGTCEATCSTSAQRCRKVSADDPEQLPSVAGSS